jgi:hypothetical protein
VCEQATAATVIVPSKIEVLGGTATGEQAKSAEGAEKGESDGGSEGVKKENEEDEEEDGEEVEEGMDHDCFEGAADMLALAAATGASPPPPPPIPCLSRFNQQTRPIVAPSFARSWPHV